MRTDLSPREREVLRLFGEGNTVSEIATQLSISVKTVSTYRTRLLDKLEDVGAIQRRTTAQLIRYAVTSAAPGANA